MTTSLAQQLSRLAAPQTDILDHTKKKVSILFTAKDAKKYSKETFFQIGCSGFSELQEMNREFDKYEESLFGKKTLNLQRVVENTEFNEKLDRKIEDFLLLLSPYLEKQASLKALEWLLHRFYISSMNTNALLMCIFPYYESTLFARILQVMELRNKNEWLWLFNAQKEGIFLTKQIVYARWSADQSFRNFVNDYLNKMLKIHKMSQNLKIAISFFITTQMGGINSVNKVEEKHVSAISMSLTTCLKSTNIELIAGVYFMLIHLALKTQLSHVFIQQELAALCKDPPPKLVDQLCLCLLTIVNHQNVSAFSPKAIGMISANQPLLGRISSLAREKSVAPFVAPYVEGKARELFEASVKGKESKSEFESLFKYILEMPLTPIESSKVIRSFIVIVHENMEAFKSLGWCVDEVVRRLEASHPEGTDQAAIKFFLAAYGKDGRKSSKVTHLAFDKSKLSSFLDVNDHSGLGEILDTVLTNDKALLKTIGKENLHAECQRILEKSEKGADDDENNDMEVIRFKAIRVISQITFAQVGGEDCRLKFGLKYLQMLMLSNHSSAGKELKVFLKSKLANVVPILGKLNEESGKKLKDTIWERMPKVLDQLEASENEKILDEMELQLENKLDCSSQFFLLCILESFMRMDGESLLHHRIAANILNFCKTILKDPTTVFKSPKFEEEVSSIDYMAGAKVAAKNLIPLDIVIVSLECVLKYVRLQLLSNPQIKKPYWTIQDNSTDDFGESLNMLMQVLDCMLVLQHRKQEDCAKRLAKYIFGNVLVGINQWRFLSVIWYWHPEVPSETINVNLKLWTINLAKNLIAESIETDDLNLFGISEPVVPSLFVTLCQGDDELCQATLGLFKLLEFTPCPDKESFADVVKIIIKFKTEIACDFSHLPIALASVTKQTKREKIVKMLLTCITNESVSPHVKCSLLYALSEISEIHILGSLIHFGNSLLNKIQVLEEETLLDPISSMSLYYILMRFASANADFLSVKGGWELFQRCIGFSKEVMKVTDNVFAPLDLVIDYNVLKGLDFQSDQQLKLLDTLLTRAVVSKTSKEASKLRKELRKMSIDASRLVVLLERFQLIPKVKSVKDSRAKKIPRRQSLASSDSESETVINWRKLGLVVELVGVMANITHPWLLVGLLCNHLHHTFMLDPSLVDILQQQILSLLHHILEVSTKSLEDNFAKQVELDVVVIVRCIRSSHNPDIHRRALLILAIGAKYFPTQVLHSIMAIFTFMGSSLVRRDDAYSFQVIHMTIDSIIPALIKSEHSDKLALLKKLSQVTQVFVDALPDIATHRRLTLFTQLAVTMGVTDYLWLLMVLIADAYVMHTMGSTPARSGVLPSNIQFALLLYNQFTIEEQLAATVEIFNFLSALPEEKKALKNMSIANKYLSVVTLDMHSSKQMKHLKFVSLGLIVRLVTSEQFIGQLYDFTSNKSEDPLAKKRLQNVYEKLLKKGMDQLKIVMDNESNYAEKGDSHFGFALKKKLIDFIDAVNSLLPPPILIGVVTTLLQTNVSVLRLRAMELLAQKLQPDVEFFEERDYKSVIDLAKVLKDVGSSKKEEDSNRQVALFGLQLMIRKLGSEIPNEIILGILIAQCKLLSEEGLSLTIMTQSILVIGEVVSVLKVAILPQLKSFLPQLILIMSNKYNEHLLLSAVTCIQKLIDIIPQFLSGYMSDLIVGTCFLLNKAETEYIQKDSAKESRLAAKIVTVHQNIVEKVEPRLAVPSLCESYKKISSSKNFDSLAPHLRLTESFINGVKPSDLLTYKSDLIDLFTIALDIRSSTDKSSNINNLEDCVMSAFCRFLLKLNEDANLRIFINLIAWAQEDGRPYRLTVLFKLSNKLAGVLKVLFIKAKLAERLLEPAIDILDTNNTMSNEGENSFGEGTDAEECASELVTYVIDTLCKIFTYDSVQFTNEERFTSLLNPLVNQIENMIGGEERSLCRTVDHLKVCMVSFTKALSDDALWKEFNRLILTKLRNDDSRVTLACLEIFEGLVESLGEDYLQPLLADIMPAITEVLESQDADVEKKTKQIFAKMEAILGDNLRAYLDN